MSRAARLHVIVTESTELPRVPARVWRRAEAQGWPTCDVCRLPVDAAALVPGQPQRHPGCICESCDAPLGQGDERWHPQCRPTNPVRRLRIVGRRS